jgi:pectinesterase
MKILKLVLAFVLICSIFACNKDEEALSGSKGMGTIPDNFSPLAGTVTTITVAKDGTGNYSTVQAAINAVVANNTSRTVISVKNGTYSEVVTIPSNKINISIIGQSETGVVITFGNAANLTNPATGTTYGTGGSATFFSNGAGLFVNNVTIANSSGTANGPGLAVNITSDKTVFTNCKFLGRQDTWYGSNCRVYLKNCYVEGTTDFVFGSATAYFDGCSIYSYGGTALTAANTASYITYGLVFNGCTVTGASGVSTLLGRTWGGYAATTFVNSSLSSIISAAGWNDWGNTANDATARYSEYGNTGAGASTSGRVSWDKLLTSSQAASYTSYLNVLKTTYSTSPITDNWDPYGVINDPSSSPTTQIVSGATYSIISVNSPGKGLDVTNASTTNGTAIQQWNYVGATNQQFTINDVGNGYYDIVNVNSGKCLDVTNSSTANGAIVQQWGYAGGTNQQWQIISTSGGNFEILNRNSGKCLDVTGQSTSNGAAIQQYTFANGANQLWQLTKL